MNYDNMKANIQVEQSQSFISELGLAQESRSAAWPGRAPPALKSDTSGQGSRHHQ